MEVRTTGGRKQAGSDFERAKCESRERCLAKSRERRGSRSVIHTSHKLTYYDRGSRAL
jgi:hypothetical protein